MSFWTDALRALQQVTLLQYKVEQALTVAEEARRHSIETRERLIQLETLIDLAMKRPAPPPIQPQLPEN
ncbi:MAG: hypothetical protein J7500_14910 [Sphingomonas sp.]|uniref:hypothetical protein n=1 Tax=Sphingomonas sp. TaxID=28214 RepID=UPI001B1963D8|nr:hypothetical protein [Sphingomonas sp.]MBO9623997.1 hypothetical protein [Sphingomonas sp.]